jgi:peptide/nickel transport system permease protein
MSAISPPEDVVAAAPPVSEPVIRRRRRVRLLRFLIARDPLACVLVSLFLLAAVLGPFIAPHSQTSVNLFERLQGPSSQYVLGTDQYGRDLLSRILGAARVAGEASLIVLLIGGIIGTILGSLAGGFGGPVDLLISRLTEIVQGFPIILLAIAIVAVTGPSLAHAMIAVGIGSIPDFVRVSRSIAIQLRTREFVEAARSMGASEVRILWSEVLPNMAGALIVIGSFNAAQAVMYEATLSFLGLGVQPPEPSYGGMLSEAKAYLNIQPWYAIVVGIALAAFILGLNLLGDAFSDYYHRGGRS